MQELGTLNYFLGISTTNDGVYLSQKSYLRNLLKRFNMTKCKCIKTPMEELADSDISMSSGNDEDLNS